MNYYSENSLSTWNRSAINTGQIIIEDNVHNTNNSYEENKKTIGYFGGISLLVNSMTGPALLSIPAIVQGAGWVSPTIIVLVMWLISTFASWALCESMSRIPGNGRFQDSHEFTSLAKYHFGRKPYLCILGILNICLLSLNVASMIATSQSVDFALLQLFEKNCGLLLTDFHWKCVTPPADQSTPFGDVYIFTGGLLLVILVVVPLGYINLNNNIIVQKAAFVSILSMVALWTIDFIRVGLAGKLPPFAADQNDVLGTVMFNFVVSVAIPSWINEKAPEVNAKVVSAASTLIAGSIFLYTGLLGSIAFHFGSNSDLISTLTNCDECWFLTRMTAYYLPIAVFLTSIPVYSIIVRYNLVENKICGKKLAFVFSVLFPWCIAVPFYAGKGLITVINWASLFLQSTLNFILPLVIYLKARRQTDEQVPFFSMEEHFVALPKWMPATELAVGVILLIIVSVGFVVTLNVVT